MSATDSAVSLLQLWRLCVQSQGRPADPHGVENVLQWSTLRKAVDGLPKGCCATLHCSSVDEILRRHFGAEGEHVNFTRYWRGMEGILQACGNFRGGGLRPRTTQQKVDSLRQFRDAVLEELPASSGRPWDTHTIGDLRRLCERQGAGASEAVAQFWQERLLGLQAYEDEVTGDMIAEALHEWVEVLLKDIQDPEPSSSDEPEEERTPAGAEERPSWAIVECGEKRAIGELFEVGMRDGRPKYVRAGDEKVVVEWSSEKKVWSLLIATDSWMSLVRRPTVMYQSARDDASLPTIGWEPVDGARWPPPTFSQQVLGRRSVAAPVAASGAAGEGRTARPLPPPPRRLVSGRDYGSAPPASAASSSGDLAGPTGALPFGPRTGAESARGGAGAASHERLLAGRPAPGEPPEVSRFLEQIVHCLPADGASSPNETSLLQLYRGVRDALDEAGAPGAAGAARRHRALCLRHGVGRLEGVARRQVRAAFRELDGWVQKQRLRDEDGPSDLITQLICCQAQAAEKLQMQQIMVPWSMRIGWLLARARRRTLGSSLARWQAAAEPPSGDERYEDRTGSEARQPPLSGRAPLPGHGTPQSSPARLPGPPPPAGRPDEASPSHGSAARWSSRSQNSPAGAPLGEVARRAAQLNRASAAGAPAPARMRE